MPAPNSTSEASAATQLHGMHINNIINNPALTDWFFHVKTVQSWLWDTLDAEWYWYRYEYQARGSTHAHGCVKLKNDPGLCNLVNAAAIGWMEEEKCKTFIKNGTDSPLNQHIIVYGQQ